MSNGIERDDIKKNADLRNTEPVPSPKRVLAGAPSTEPSTETWSQIGQDLRTALDTWTEVSEKCRVRKSPEDRKLEEMKRLLADLQSKLRDFEAL